MNFAWNARLLRSIQVSFTCRKSTTWDGRLYFPSEGRRPEDFFAMKNPTASAWFEPANLGTKGQHATSRPSKPQVAGLQRWQNSHVLLYFAYRKEALLFEEDTQCKWILTLWRLRVNIVAMETLHSVCMIELHATVNDLKILSPAQQCFYGESFRRQQRTVRRSSSVLSYIFVRL